jgi:LysR family transcriptional regulator, cys regulon transcriptional activator
MTLRQLRILREISRRSLNISAAAGALHTSQPGLSRQIQLLEQELGVDLLVRRKNRITGLTEAGGAVLAAAERALSETENIHAIAAEFKGEAGGRLTVATSHLHARYSLLTPIKTFALGHRGVQLHMRQADPDEILKLVLAGESDIGISTEVGGEHAELVFLPGRAVERSLIMPVGHPLAAKRRITLADIAAWPLVGYNPQQRGGQIIAGTFRERGLEPQLVVSAIDSDVVKAYVGEGLGIAVVPSISLDPEIDRQLVATDVTGLFPRSVMTVSLRRDAYLRRYVSDFVQLVAPAWTHERITQALRPAADAGAAKPRGGR